MGAFTKSVPFLNEEILTESIRSPFKSGYMPLIHSPAIRLTSSAKIISGIFERLGKLLIKLPTDLNTPIVYKKSEYRISKL